MRAQAGQSINAGKACSWTRDCTQQAAQHTAASAASLAARCCSVNRRRRGVGISGVSTRAHLNTWVLRILDANLLVLVHPVALVSAGERLKALCAQHLHQSRCRLK